MSPTENRHTSLMNSFVGGPRCSVSQVASAVAIAELALVGPRYNEARAGCIVGECRTTPPNPLRLVAIAVSGHPFQALCVGLSTSKWAYVRRRNTISCFRLQASGRGDANTSAYRKRSPEAVQLVPRMALWQAPAASRLQQMT